MEVAGIVADENHTITPIQSEVEVVGIHEHLIRVGSIDDHVIILCVVPVTRVIVRITFTVCILNTEDARNIIALFNFNIICRSPNTVICANEVICIFGITVITFSLIIDVTSGIPLNTCQRERCRNLSAVGRHETCVCHSVLNIVSGADFCIGE